MTMFRFGPLLALAGAACLVAWTPEGRPPPPEVATLDRAPGSRFDAAPTETASVTRTSRPAIAAPPTLGDQRVPAHSSANGVATREAGLGGAPPPPPEAVRSNTDFKVEFAYADLEGAAPVLGAPSEAAPLTAAAVPELSAPTPGPELSAPAADAALPPPPPVSQAAIVYRKGDVAGLIALAAAAHDAGERSALEWASLRADAHPSFASLAAFLVAHPSWPSRGWIRERQEAELAAHPLTPALVTAFFAGEPPQSSAGKIAATRAPCGARAVSTP
jgi:hypothetical protein